MMRKIGQPRYIDPSLIEIGDDISAEHEPAFGITMTLRGIVGTIHRHGKERLILTKEGSLLMSYEIGRKYKVKVILYGREEPEQSTIFDLLDDVRERIA